MALNSLSIDLSTFKSNLKLEDLKNAKHFGEKKMLFILKNRVESH